MKAFELRGGVTRQVGYSPSCVAAKVDGGFIDGRFLASLMEVAGNRVISGKIKDPRVYDKILQAHLSREDVMILLLVFIRIKRHK